MLHLVYFILNLLIVLATLAAESYFLLYRFNKCTRKKNPYPDLKLMDKSAVVIVIFYTVGFFLKFAGALLYQIHGYDQ
jgi:uncharacterized membrane protein YidH (DUF202 family)